MKEFVAVFLGFLALFATLGGVALLGYWVNTNLSDFYMAVYGYSVGAVTLSLIGAASFTRGDW